MHRRICLPQHKTGKLTSHVIFEIQRFLFCVKSAKYKIRECGYLTRLKDSGHCYAFIALFGVNTNFTVAWNQYSNCDFEFVYDIRIFTHILTLDISNSFTVNQ